MHARHVVCVAAVCKSVCCGLHVYAQVRDMHGELHREEWGVRGGDAREEDDGTARARGGLISRKQLNKHMHSTAQHTGTHHRSFEISN